mmetsp:Transcript_80447/g.260670  ORF Transcript_80447/g.260670 Transcript_80447/m.260670 type:complete len:614 (+) Transcript_80447:62-1903(+)
MKALNKLRKSLAAEDAEASTQRVAMPEFKISIVRVKPQQARKHKVIQYGYRKLVDGDVPEMYRFQYLPDEDQPDDLHPGVVPCGFSAGVPVDDNMIYFHTREGVNGPEYQVVYTQPDPDGGDTPSYSMALEWDADVDAIWIEALQRLEDSKLVTERALDFLDADPLWLFGIADPATQRALEKTSVVPMLKCLGQRPCLEEWFAYLNADEKGDADYKWVVESFAEVELPQPWTSYKGVGSVVCYLNNETNETTAIHPYYDYFYQLLNHCRRSTTEEHIKLRINRVLWSYEAESQTDVQNQMPLVSPKYVKLLGEILGIDLLDEPFMVRTLKTFLKAFSQMYHEGELDTQEVKWCLEIVDNERAKSAVAKTLDMEMDPSEQLDSQTNGQLFCIEYPRVRDWVSPPAAPECNKKASCYCPECGDCFCELCFERLHERGCRKSHEPNYFIDCDLCKKFPAKLQCTYMQGKFCVDCYTKRHAKELPRFLDLKPLKIDYKRSMKPDSGNASLAGTANMLIEADAEVKEGFSKPAPLETLLPEKWHAFYDLRGVKYYYNFETQESMRRPQEDLVNPPAPEDAERTKSRHDIVSRLAMSKDPRLLPAWEEGKVVEPPPRIR